MGAGQARLQQVQLFTATVAFLLTAWVGSSCVAAALQQQQQSFMTVALANVQARVETRYSWSVSATADPAAITVPVASNVGWPQVSYTVSYTRNREPQTVYVLVGSVVISTKDNVASAFNTPSITVTSSSGNMYRVPEEAIQCPSLVVPAGGQVTCTFAAGYIGRQPLPGSMSASISLAGTLIPIQLEAVPVTYDFTNAETLNTGAFATASSYFEMGSGIIQPYGVFGEQPPPGLRLEDSRVFRFIAVFGGVTASSVCGRTWKAVNTAELTPSSSDSSLPAPKKKSSQVAIGVSVSGCEAALAPGFAQAGDGLGQQQQQQQQQVPPAAMWPPLAAPAAVAAPAAPAAPPAGPVPDVPGVQFAEAGSTICGRGVCPKGQLCFDGWNCCPVGTPVCGGTCCAAPSTCSGNKCIPPGGKLCGTTNVCKAGETCTFSNVCCPATSAPCGNGCCGGGQACVLGMCAPPGSQACGATVCTPGQTCLSQAGVCCAQGETSCAGRCCPTGNTCLQNQFCVPTGSTMCGGGQICNPGQQCAGGMLCCDVGASFCGGACCPATSQCQADRCLVPGQSICGAGLICSVGQTCQGGVVCCNQGETFCNNACCAQGNTCINNQCVVTGSVACGPTVCPPNQICGNTQTGLCCQNLQQFGCGNTCCNTLNQVCNQFTQQCTERFNTACAAGQFWCPGANQCCPVGQVCSFNQCVPRNAFGHRHLLTSAQHLL